eukprot:14987369-Ditylum_brightwellii.AAC.1
MDVTIAGHQTMHMVHSQKEAYDADQGERQTIPTAASPPSPANQPPQCNQGTAAAAAAEAAVELDSNSEQ